MFRTAPSTLRDSVAGYPARFRDFQSSRWCVQRQEPICGQEKVSKNICRSLAQDLCLPWRRSRRLAAVGGLSLNSPGQMWLCLGANEAICGQRSEWIDCAWSRRQACAQLGKGRNARASRQLLKKWKSSQWCHWAGGQEPWNHGGLMDSELGIAMWFWR